MSSKSDKSIRFHGDVGERIRKAREMRLYSQAKLSRRSGLSQSHVSRIEAGERAASIYAIARIADALQVSTDYLIGVLAGAGAGISLKAPDDDPRDPRNVADDSSSPNSLFT